MKSTKKPRLPVGVVEKLSKNTGGGKHKAAKGQYSRKRDKKEVQKKINEDNERSPFVVFFEQFEQVFPRDILPAWLQERNLRKLMPD
jgi:hypothetical protein